MSIYVSQTERVEFPIFYLMCRDHHCPRPRVVLQRPYRIIIKLVKLRKENKKKK